MKNLQPDIRVTDAAGILLSRNLKRLRKHLRLAARFADKDIEHVHRLRISTRRCIAALDIFREFFPAQKRKKITRRLKNTRDAASKARDLDVMIDEQKNSDMPDKHLIKQLIKKRARAQKPVKKMHDRLRGRNQIQKDRQWLRDVLLQWDGSDQPVYGSWAKEMVEKQASLFFKKQPKDVTDLIQLHRFRIAAKKLRYTLELLQPALPSESVTRVAKEIKQLQKMLGRLNDSAVSICRIRRLKEKGHAIKPAVLECEIDNLDFQQKEFADWWTPEKIAAIRGNFKALSQT